MPSLYDITGDALALMNGLTELDADEATKYAAAAAFLEGASAEKLEAYARVLRTLEAEENACKLEADRFAQKASVAGRAQDRMKQAVLDHLQALGVSEAPAGLFKFSVVNNGGQPPIVMKGDPPMDYSRTTISPDMVKIRTALENGESLPFAELGQRGCHVRVR